MIDGGVSAVSARARRGSGGRKQAGARGAEGSYDTYGVWDSHEAPACSMPGAGGHPDPKAS